MQRTIANIDNIDINDHQGQACIRQQAGKRRGLDARMDVGGCAAVDGVGGEHCLAQAGQAVAAGDCAHHQTAWFENKIDCRRRQLKVIGRIQKTDGEAKIEPIGVVRKGFQIGAAGVRPQGHQRPGFNDADVPRRQSGGPVGVGASSQQDLVEIPADIRQPLQAIVERAVEKKCLGADPDRAITTHGAKPVIEKGIGHEPACATARARRQGRMQSLASPIKAAGRWVIDLALPPRCPCCGTIVIEVQAFCAECWRQIDWLGDGGCSTCGLPLEATDLETCGACLAKPPLISRTRAAVAYGETTRSLPLRLKYSRKVALAKTMARYMRPLLGSDGDPVLVPVPLHPSRLWGRGFNQAALLANELARISDIDHDPFVLRRRKRTSALKDMSPAQRRREVAGAFAVTSKAPIDGRKVILVDDVLTTGSTAEACARTLRRAGAGAVELICWARVVRPAQIMR